MKNKIYTEIEEIAPLLASIHKSNPFIVPEGYFSSLEQRIEDVVGNATMYTNTPPEGYFENLSDQILKKVAQEEKTKIIPFYKHTWLKIAASFIIVAGAIYIMNTQATTIENAPEYTMDIEADEALDYLVENDDLYLSDLMDFNIYEYELEGEISDFEILEETDLHEFLNNLDQEDLEDLL